MQIPEGTVKRRLFDARKQVKEGMEKMPTVTEMMREPDVAYMDLCERISNILKESREEILEIGNVQACDMLVRLALLLE